MKDGGRAVFTGYGMRPSMMVSFLKNAGAHCSKCYPGNKTINAIKAPIIPCWLKNFSGIIIILNAPGPICARLLPSGRMMSAIIYSGSCLICRRILYAASTGYLPTLHIIPHDRFTQSYYFKRKETVVYAGSLHTACLPAGPVPAQGHYACPGLFQQHPKRWMAFSFTA